MIHLMILLKLKKIFFINYSKLYSLFLFSSRTCDIIITVSCELVKFLSILTDKSKNSLWKFNGEWWNNLFLFW